MADVESAESVAARVVMLATTRGAYPNDDAIAAVLRQWREDIRREAFEEVDACLRALKAEDWNALETQLVQSRGGWYMTRGEIAAIYLSRALGGAR